MIRLTIQRKVFLATFVQALVLAGLLLGLTRWNLEQGFNRYVVETEIARLDWLRKQIEDAYARQGDWGFLEDGRPPWGRAFDPPGPPGNRPPPPPMESPSWARQPPPYQPQSDKEPQSPVTRPPPGESITDGGHPTRPASHPESEPRRPGYDEDPRAFPGPSRFEDRPPPPFDHNAPPFGPPGFGPGGGFGPGAGNRPGSGPGDLLEIGPRLSIRDPAGVVLAGNPSGDGPSASRPIRVQGETVGNLTLLAPTTEAAQDAAFLSSQTRDLWFSGLAALVLSLIAAALLARQFLGPIKALARGTRQIAEGRQSQPIVVPGSDELSALASDFNTMADMLERTEEARRSWVADSSHELRTPIAVLRAEIEAMQDGVRSADERTLARLLKRVMQMGQLVDDLRQTLDREGAEMDLHLAPLEPLEVLRETLEDFRPRLVAADLALDATGIPPGDPGWRIRGDAERLQQIFGNLIENSLRYTLAGGRLMVTASAGGGSLCLQFDDTPPAPPDRAMTHLFERFFRAEPSRSRLYGGAGLGLAICKTLVAGHGGTITAARSDLGGLSIRIELPLER